MNEAMLQEVLRVGLDNISDNMSREDIIKTLTDRGIDIGKGMEAMKSMWSDRFTDEERLEIIQDCYTIMLETWLDEALCDEPDPQHLLEIELTLKEIDKNRKGVAEMIKLWNEREGMRETLMDKVLEEFDTEEMPRC